MTTKKTQPNTPPDLANKSLGELQKLYLEVVGEKTRCPNKVFLTRKIAEAQQRSVAEIQQRILTDIPTAKAAAPKTPGPRSKDPREHQMVPIRLPREAVLAMDEAWARMGHGNRNTFVRNAIITALSEAGEAQAAKTLERLGEHA